MAFEAKNDFNPDALDPEGGRDLTKEKKPGKRLEAPAKIEQVVDEPEYELRMNNKGRCLGGVLAKGNEYSEFVTFYSDLNFDQGGERAKNIVERAFESFFKGDANKPKFSPDSGKMFVTVRFEP